MSQTKVTKSKGKHERPKLKVMHHIEKDGNGQPTIRSVVSQPPKLREAVDSQQAAEETAHLLPKLTKPRGHPQVPKTKKEPKAKDELTELDHKILKALDDLGGKDISSIDMAKKIGTTRTHPDAPRAPIRAAMQAFEKLGYVKSEKKGAKYLFSITEKGKLGLQPFDVLGLSVDYAPHLVGVSPRIPNISVERLFRFVEKVPGVADPFLQWCFLIRAPCFLNQVTKESRDFSGVLG